VASEQAFDTREQPRNRGDTAQNEALFQADSVFYVEHNRRADNCVYLGLAVEHIVIGTPPAGTWGAQLNASKHFIDVQDCLSRVGLPGKAKKSAAGTIRSSNDACDTD
jgi:hypothetical protein